MPPEHNEVDKFFAGLPGEDKQVADIFADETPNPEAGRKAPEEGGSTDQNENGAEAHKNRRHRRLESQLEREREERQREHEERVRIEARLAAIESGKTPSIDERLVRLYGSENTEAARIHMELLQDFGQQAEEKAFERFQSAVAQEAEEVGRYQSEIDNELENIEDTENVDITSDSPRARKTRTELLNLVEKLSPKDEQGNIIAYADFGQAWDILKTQSSQSGGSATTERAKEIAGRTMQRGGVGQAAPKAPTPGFEGWKRDFGLE